MLRHYQPCPPCACILGTAMSQALKGIVGPLVGCTGCDAYSAASPYNHYWGQTAVSRTKGRKSAERDGWVFRLS